MQSSRKNQTADRKKEEKERILREKRAAAEVGQMAGVAAGAAIATLLYGLFFSKSKCVRLVTLAVLVAGVWWFFGDAIAAKLNASKGWGRKVSVFVADARDLCVKANESLRSLFGRGQTEPHENDTEYSTDTGPVGQTKAEGVTGTEDETPPPIDVEEESSAQEAVSPLPEEAPSDSGWAAPCIW